MEEFSKDRILRGGTWKSIKEYCERVFEVQLRHKPSNKFIFFAISIACRQFPIFEPFSKFPMIFSAIFLHLLLDEWFAESFSFQVNKHCVPLHYKSRDYGIFWKKNCAFQLWRELPISTTGGAILILLTTLISSFN